MLIVASTTGYQIRTLSSVARRIGVGLVFVSDRCSKLDDPWGDDAISVDFGDEQDAVASLLETKSREPIDGVISFGDRPAVIGAHIANALGLLGNTPDAVEIAGNKLLTRLKLCSDGLPSPQFRAIPLHLSANVVSSWLRFPCVVKPVALSASRGVMKADNREEFRYAVERLHSLLSSDDVRGLRNSANELILVEDYIPGVEVAIEGLVTDGVFRLLAVFDKPGLQDGPFFEESIYVRPTGLAKSKVRHILCTVTEAVSAVGITHGPVHIECRINDNGVYILEIAARPIGGLCSRVLRFENCKATDVSLEELLCRHSLGENVDEFRVMPGASGVMMIPIPRHGRLRGVHGVERAKMCDGVEDVVISAKTGQELIPLPEGGSYLGFIFARASNSSDVVSVLNSAHGCLSFDVSTSITVSRH